MTAPERPQPARKRKGGIVVPRKLKWYHHVFSWLIYAGIRCVSSTWRCRFHDPHGVFHDVRGPLIFCLWHNRLAISMKAWESWGKKRLPASGLVALISASHDGGVLAQALRYFGVCAVRGSSSRRGAQALLELTTYTEKGFNIAITPDGPRGPKYVVQDGVLALAQLSGLPILPISARIRGKLTTRSWDRFQIPLPFARCDVSFGQPLHVPADADDTARAELRRELQDRLAALTTD